MPNLSAPTTPKAACVWAAEVVIQATEQQLAEVIERA